MTQEAVGTDDSSSVGGVQSPPLLTVTGIDPTSGIDSGGERVTISGTGLDAPTHVMFGEAKATILPGGTSSGVNVLSPAAVGARPPAYPVDVVVSSSSGVSTPTTEATFVYVAPSRWTALHSAFILLIVMISAGSSAGFVASVGSGPLDRTGVAAQIVWLITLVALLLALIVMGDGLTGRWSGMLIDDRNRISASRLQFVIWSVLILSVPVSVTLQSIGAGGVRLTALPQEIWAVLAISAASIVGTPLILSTKRAMAVQPVDDTRFARAAKRVGQVERIPPNQIRADGIIIAKSIHAYARWSDAVKGDEVGNFADIDISKVQLLAVTIVVAMLYGSTLFSFFGLPLSVRVTTDLPSLDLSAIVVLGVSHVTYLWFKLVSHTPSQPPIAQSMS